MAPECDHQNATGDTGRLAAGTGLLRRARPVQAPMKLYLDLKPAGIVRAIRNLLAAGIPIRDEFHILNHWR